MINQGIRVLVTGAAGFIGSHVADSCLRQGMTVVATDDLSGGFIDNVPKGCEFLRGDLKDPEFCASLWQRGPFQFIHHLAAYAAEGLSHFIRRYNYQTNLLASINLINESVKRGGVDCFIFASSIAVYGRNQLPMTEELTPQPEDPYGISKYAIELDLRAAHEMFGLNYAVFRPHNVYGERQNIADRYRNVIGIFMNQVLQSKPMTIFGDGSQTRAFSHVDDVAPLIARAALAPSSWNQVYNVGADTPYTILELAKTVAQVLDRPCELRHLEARNEVVHAFSDHSKVRRIFSPPDPIDLRTGLRRMAQWVLARGPASPVRFENIEVTKNLPPAWQ
jgi:UDP-glucose 4-epimerase